MLQRLNNLAMLSTENNIVILRDFANKKCRKVFF